MRFPANPLARKCRSQTVAHRRSQTVARAGRPAIAQRISLAGRCLPITFMGHGKPALVTANPVLPEIRLGQPLKDGVGWLRGGSRRRNDLAPASRCETEDQDPRDRRSNRKTKNKGCHDPRDQRSNRKTKNKGCHREAAQGCHREAAQGCHREAARWSHSSWYGFFSGCG